MALDDYGDPLVAILEAHAAFFLLKGICLGGEERGDADNVIIIGILVLVHVGVGKFPTEDLLVRFQAATRMDPVDAHSHEMMAMNMKMTFLICFVGFLFLYPDNSWCAECRDICVQKRDAT